MRWRRIQVDMFVESGKILGDIGTFDFDLGQNM